MSIEPHPKNAKSLPDHYALLVELQDFAILILDVEGRVVTWNGGARAITGFEQEDVVGRHVAMLYVAEDISGGEPARQLGFARERGRAEIVGFRARKDGSRFWSSTVITALREPSGTLHGFGVVMRDLTAEHRVAEDLKRSEERFRLLVEGASDYAIYMLDPAGRITTWNSGAENIKGYTASEVVGKHLAIFFTPEDVSAGRPERELEIAFESGRFEEEGWRVRKDGGRFWASVVVTALRDSRGAHLGFVKVTRDLTARRAAEETAHELVRQQTARAVAEEGEETLRAERERYKALSARLEAILEGVADAITVQGADGALMFANSTAARLCGFSSAAALLSATAEEVTARFEIFDEAGNPIPNEELPASRVLAGASAASALMHVRERNTERDWWSLVRASAVRGEGGKPELAINIWHDVTAERRREEFERYLARATSALASSLDYQETLSTLAALLVPGLADWCAIHLLEGEALKDVAVAHVDPARVAVVRAYQRNNPPDPQQRAGLWSVIRTGKSELYADVPDELLEKRARDAEHLQLLRDIGMKSVIIVPIVLRDRILGTISLVASAARRRFDRQDVTLAEELGRRAGAAIENSKLYAAEKRAREQLELLAQAGQALSGTFDYEETLRRVVRITLPTLGDFAFFDVVEGKDVRRLAAAHEDEGLEAVLRETKWVRSERTDMNLCALSSGEAGFHPNIDDAWMQRVAVGPEHLALLRRLALCSMVTVPLRGRGDLLGALTICYGRSGRHHAPDDVGLAEELARRAGIAVVQARLYEEAQAAVKRALEAAQRAEEASRIKDEFLATVSHELRTPLNAVLGWATLLRDRDLEPSIAKGIEVIHRNAKAQGKIIEDILDVSRIITGKLRLDLRPADLAALVRDSIEVVAPSAAAKRIAIHFDKPQDDCLLVADPERIQQVIWNLLSNAVKFTEPGGRVDVTVVRDQSRLTLSVTDTGRGIEVGFLPFVFDRFKQADSSTTRAVGGLGLGLAIVRHIVELHGGHVRAASSGLDQGSKFTITLPVRAVAPAAGPSEAPSSVRTATAPPSGSASLAEIRVLVVDDDPDARDLLVAVLSEAGAIVQSAGSAVEGVALLERFEPHILVSDIGMPDEDGYAFMQRVRATSERGRTIPAIALTAYTRAEDKAKAAKVGFSMHVGKPVIPDDLVAAVAELAASIPRQVGRS